MADHPDDLGRRSRGNDGEEALSANTLGTRQAAPAVRAEGGNAVIAAISTAQGRGAVGIVRLSGPDLSAFAAALASGLPRPRQATRTRFLDASGRALDEGLAIYFPAPHSYTGEAVLELQGHGGPVVLSMVLVRCLELGARLAQPGEFTRRAFLNDKLDLAQAEAVADLIDAASESAARCALRSLQGEFSQAVSGLAAKLVELRALVEAMLDFPEEEVDALDRRDAARRLDAVAQELARALDQARRGSLLRSGISVVIAGQPNVGKSSLMNRLSGEDLAIVTPVPGTTRDALRQSIQIEGVPINVIDTAGLRETDDLVESIGIERAWSALQRADVVLLLVDARAGVTAVDEALAARLPAGALRITVFNKIDLCPAPDGGRAAAASTHLENAPRPGRTAPRSAAPAQVAVSAKTGEGMDALRAGLLEAAGWQPGGEDVFMARERHLEALANAAACLERARALLDRPELFAEELRIAHRVLGAITGEFSADDLLGEIFARFCIGK